MSQKLYFVINLSQNGYFVQYYYSFLLSFDFSRFILLKKSSIILALFLDISFDGDD